MAQGRISFSGNSAAAYGFVTGSETLQRFGLREAVSDKVDKSSGLTESIVSRLIPEIADQWIMDSIERKRSLLHQVTLPQRQRIGEFVELLFDEQSDRCQEMADAVSAETGDPQNVVDRLFEPAVRDISDKRRADECNFLQATIAMSRMQSMFRRIVAKYPPRARPDLTRCALLAPVPGSGVNPDCVQQQMFGITVMEDAFRRAGWEVDCRGSREENETFRLAASGCYRIICVSVSADHSIASLISAVRKLRSKSCNKSVVLMAGGSMVMQNPRSALEAGFDLLAVDALSAVALAEAVVASDGVRPVQRVAAE